MRSKKMNLINTEGLFSLESKEGVVESLSSRMITRKSVMSTITKSSTPSKNTAFIIERIKDLVIKKLNKYKEECIIINDKLELQHYIEVANQNKIIAIDTETTSLDVLNLKLVGISLYTPNMKAAYIPINHISYISYQRTEGQLSDSEIFECFSKLEAKVLMHNAYYDLRVLYYTLNLNLKLYWDTMIAEKLLINGTLKSSGLKPTYSRYLQLEEEALSFDDYFKGITFDLVPYQLGYLYAAMDAKMTYVLYKFQKDLYSNSQYLSLYSLFRRVEMPIIRVVFDMFIRGISYDVEFNNNITMKYKKELDVITDDIYKELSKFKTEIDNYRRLNINCKLSDPISINSPLQIAIFLYDIVKLEPVVEKKPRSTDEEVLNKLIDDPEVGNFCKLFLKYREINKLITTYLEKMPEEVSKDGKIHTKFNSVGTVTGRFSSEGPNLQNIPSSKDIRNAFTSSKGNYLISCDYSSQEPRIIAHLSKDPVMIQAFKEGKDFYAFLGSNAYNLSYDECKEYYPDGTPNPNGKVIRDRSKKTFLGLCYGMKSKKLSEQMFVTLEEAVEIRDLVLKACPGLKMLLDDSVTLGRKQGYVETLWGRRRYLNNINKPMYEFEFKDNSKVVFDPLSFDKNMNYDPYEKVKKVWLNKLNKARGFWNKLKIIQNAKEEGINIIDNSGYIEEDKRFCINTRVQGTAADMTKQAMITINNNEELKNLGFKLLLTVHDEVIGECPINNVKKAIPILEQCMLEPTLDLIVPFKVDTTVSTCWYGEEIMI